MATSVTAAALPAANGGSARDLTTPLIAAVGLAALALLQWSPGGGDSALWLFVAGAEERGPHDTPVTALGPVVLAAVAALAFAWRRDARMTALAAACALAWAFAQGFAAGVNGPAFGIGAVLALTAATLCLARALGRLGLFAGNATIATIVVSIGVLLVLFIFFPVGSALVAAVLDSSGHFAPRLVADRLLTADIWGFGCLGGGTRCGVAINSALLATIVGVLSTLLGLALALVVQRGGRRYAGVLKLMSVLPIVTPPFVLALALVVLFGRTGLITGWFG